MIILPSMLKKALSEVGLTTGGTALVHSSLKSLYWMANGPAGIVDALRTVLGPEGTLVFPSHTANLSDPVDWNDPPIDPVGLDEVRSQVRPFDVSTSPSYMMGAVAEYFRTLPGSMRSNHPLYSFSAQGPRAEYITEGHENDFGLGLKSPLKKILDADGKVVLIGVDYDSCTIMHLAESIVQHGSEPIIERVPVEVNGRNEWIEFKDFDYDGEDFLEIGKRFEADSKTMRTVTLGDCIIKAFRAKELVDYSVQALLDHK